MKIAVEPTDIIQTVTNVLLYIPDFVFGGEFSVRVHYSTNAGETVKVKHVSIPPEIYAQWGTDDQYIIDYVLGQLGLIQAQLEPE